MKQDKSGGYCPKCDTVWASPGVCNCSATDRYVEVCATQIWNAGIDACIIKIQEYKVGPYYFLKTELERLKK